jgi:cell wall-associated NlpC family hydrolase
VALSLLGAGPASALDEDAGPTGPAGPSGPTATAPPGDESAGSPSGRPPTTTPSKPSKDADDEDDPPAVAKAPTAEDPTPSAGPPEVSRRGILLPDDSLVAAMEELNFERAKVEMLGQRRLQLDQSVQEGDAKVKRLRRERKEEQEQRSLRAVAAYRGQSSGWRLGAIVEPDLADERAVHMVGAADEASRDEIKRLGRNADRLEAQIAGARQERVVVEEQLDEALARLNRLLDKLAASNGTITTINGELVYVPTGPSPIAILANDADQQLVRLMATNAPLAGDARWQSTRHSLALELARAKDGNRAEVAAALERDWDATPTPVLHAMLFALRQVGKAYVYATAGPETFDCSGLTKAAYAQIRLGLPHFSGAQLHLGVPVPPESIRPGDLLAYGPDGADHVTMAIGGGLVVEAKGRAYGVIVAPARVDPAKGFAGATRIVP